MESSTAPASPTAAPLVVLVHGAWHGAWCWAALQAELDRRGVASIAVDLPGHGASTLPPTDLAGDADHTVAVLDAVARRRTGPIVLVGHSYGGAVIGQAAARRHDVAHLVYVAAFALNEGESVTSVASSGGHRVALGDAIDPIDEATLGLDPVLAVPALYGRCPEPVAHAATARLDGQPIATFAQTVSASALGAIPSSYVICTQDEAVHPAHQELMAARCTTSIELETDHSPFVSAVAPLADHLEQIVDGLATADSGAGRRATTAATEVTT